MKDVDHEMNLRVDHEFGVTCFGILNLILVFVFSPFSRWILKRVFRCFFVYSSATFLMKIHFFVTEIYYESTKHIFNSDHLRFRCFFLKEFHPSHLIL